MRHYQFLILILPLAALHEERLVSAGEVGQEVKVQGGTQVVRVRHEHVLDSLSQELNKKTQGYEEAFQRQKRACAGRENRQEF